MGYNTLMNRRKFLIGSRLFFGGLGLVAITTQYFYLAELGALLPGNFFSYFTNLSNLFASIVLIISALYLVKSRKPSVLDDIIRGAATLYMAVTGVIYLTLLSSEDLGLLLPWVNIVLHYVLPVYVIADWLFQPQQSKLALNQLPYWLLFPAGFLVYTLIRGADVGWYPYPFLDPNMAPGYAGVAIYCLAILAVFLVLGWGLMALGNKLKRNVV